MSKRLQDAERDKDGFFGLEILAESQRRASGGALVYDVAYALDSFRGKKTILTSVCITRRRLFIWTFTIKARALGNAAAVPRSPLTRELPGARAAGGEGGGRGGGVRAAHEGRRLRRH